MKVFLFRFILTVTLIGGSFGGNLDAKTHRVQKSETCYSISKKYAVPLTSLLKTNGISDPRKLRLGQVLKIPSKASSQKKAASTPTRKVATSVSRSYVKPRTRVSGKRKKSLHVIVDAGHGGRDKGAIWGGVRESDLNLRVASRVAYTLKKKGYPVTMTRQSDHYVSLLKRAQIANRYQNAIFVSIHFNATRHTYVRGAETFYAGRRGRYLASSIQRQLVGRLKVRNRGIHFKRYSVLRQTNCPAVLVECGFISNSYERSRCRTKNYQIGAAAAIVAGIEKYDRVY